MKLWTQILVDIHDGLSWSRNMTDLMKAENKAFLTYAHFYDSDPSLATKYFDKMKRLGAQIDELYTKKPQ